MSILFAHRARYAQLLIGRLATVTYLTIAAWGPLPAAAQPESAAVDLASIYERLAVQEAEIARLRDQVAELQADEQLPGPAEEELPAALRALPPTDGPESEQMSDILSRLEALEKAPEDEPPKEEKKAVAKIKEIEWTDLSTEKWTLKLGGHLQMDYIMWADASPAIAGDQNYFEFRRARLMCDGTGYGVYDFRLQMDIEPESGDGVLTPVTDLKDAYFTMHELPLVHRWRIGNFFVPFSLEQVTNDTMNIFLERSIPTQGIFAADREVGMALYGVTDNMDATWTTGVFFDSISESQKERIDDNQGTRCSGRLTWLPYYDEPSNGRYLVHTGCGVLYTNDADNIQRLRARPQIHEGPFLIDTGLFGASQNTTGNIELATVWGPFSAQSELFLSEIDLLTGATEHASGYYIYLSYFLTGENRFYERYGQHGAQFGRTTPFSNFFLVPGCCGPGAWEFKIRHSNLNLRELNSGEYNDITVGFNWYWSDRIRVMFDWIHPDTEPGTTPFGDVNADIIGMRFDYNF